MRNLVFIACYVGVIVLNVECGLDLTELLSYYWQFFNLYWVKNVTPAW